MSSIEQSPFGNVEFVDNPEPRCACLLLLDNSGSMSGPPIAELNTGLRTFQDELLADSLAAKRVEVGVVTFGLKQSKTKRFRMDARRSGRLRPRQCEDGRYAILAALLAYGRIEAGRGRSPACAA